jgi:hypothetical protein
MSDERHVIHDAAKWGGVGDIHTALAASEISRTAEIFCSLDQ